MPSHLRLRPKQILRYVPSTIKIPFSRPNFVAQELKIFTEPFFEKTPFQSKPALQISIGWLLVISSVIPLALKVILPIRIIPIGKIL